MKRLFKRLIVKIKRMYRHKITRAEITHKAYGELVVNQKSNYIKIPATPYSCDEPSFNAPLNFIDSGCSSFDSGSSSFDSGGSSSSSFDGFGGGDFGGGGASSDF